MAEVVGVLAASIEIAKVALEVKEFFSSVRHAPEKLRQVLEELEDFQEILQTHKEQEIALCAYVPPDIVHNCRRQSEKAVQGIKPICEELLRCIKQSRLRGSVKAVLKESSLDQARQVVDRSKINLMLAQTTLWNSMQIHNMGQHVETRALIVSSSESVSAINNDILQQSRSTVRMTVPNPTRSIIDDHASEARRRQQCTSVRTRRLMLLQSQLCGKAVEFVQQHAYGAWTYGFRTYSVRSWNSPVFKYTRTGDMVALQQLFRTSQASLFDRDSDGWTLLHHASHWANAPMVRFLMQQGLDPNESSFRSSSCLGLCLTSDPAKEENALGIIQVLAEHPDLDSLSNSFPHIIQDLNWWMTPKIMSQLLQLTSQPWSTWPLKDRLIAAYQRCDPPVSPVTFWLCLGQSRLDHSCLLRETYRTGHYESLVERLALSLTAFWDSEAACSDYSGWRAIFRAAVALGGLQMAFEHDCASPMLAYLRLLPVNYSPYYYSWADLSNQRLTHRLRYWAKEVLDTGQNLEEYGRLEHEHLLQGRQSCFSSLFEDDQCGRIVNFAYGPDSNDWKLWVSLTSDESVGEFFESLEFSDPMTETPGAWPGEYVAHEYDTSPQSQYYFLPDFRHSRRRRRRAVRYFDLTREQAQRFSDVSQEGVTYRTDSGKRLKKRQKQFFQETGILPPPQPRY